MMIDDLSPKIRDGRAYSVRMDLWSIKMKKMLKGTDTEQSKRCIIIYLPGKRAMREGRFA